MLKRVLPGISPIKDLQIRDLFKELCVLLNSGVDLYRCFGLIKGKENINEKLDIIRSQLLEGRQLSLILYELKMVSEYEAAMIRIGEETGALSRSFEIVYQFKDKNIELRRSFMDMVTYPIFVLVMSGLVILFMMNFVVPVFAEMLRRSGQDLPAITTMILALSSFVQKWFWYILFLVLGIFMLGSYGLRRPFLKRMLINLAFNMWGMGSILKLRLEQRLFSALAFMANAGIPIDQAVRLCKSLSVWKDYEFFVSSCLSNMSSGAMLSHSMRNFPLFSQKTINLIQIGEESGRLAEVFSLLEAEISERLNRSYKRFTKIFEPLTIMIVATIVGLILVSLYLPMFKMMGGMQLGTLFLT